MEHRNVVILLLLVAASFAAGMVVELGHQILVNLLVDQLCTPLYGYHWNSR